jgi:hypothetical protein
MTYAYSPRLDIFKAQSLQTSVERAVYSDVHPHNVIQENSPIEFECHPSSDEYTDLKNSFLYIRCRIVRVGGELLRAAQMNENGEVTNPRDNDVHPVNLPLSSMFSDVIVSFNKRVVSGGDQLYPYMSYFKAMLSSTQKCKELESAGLCRPDEVVDNLGEKHALSHWVEYVGKPFSDAFQCPVYLLNNVHILVKMMPTRGAFAISSPAGNVFNYKLEISHAVLYLRRLQVASHIILAHEQGLENQNAHYPIQRTEMQTCILGEGVQSKAFEGFTHGKLPKFLMLGLVRHSSFNGNHHEDPFNFNSFNLLQLALKKGGECVGYEVRQPENFAREFYHFMHNCHSSELEFPSLKLSDFTRDSCLFAFDLTAEGASQWYGARDGNLRLEIQFQEALPHAVTLVIMCMYDSLIEITKHREVLLDLQ